MKLYCARHGEAFSADVDPERSLTDQGKSDVAVMAQQLALHDVDIQHIMHSPKLRASQTAEIFAAYLQIDNLTEVERLLGEDESVEPLVEMIQTWTDDTMLVGHLPFMSKLVSALVLQEEHYLPIVNFPPSAVVCLEYYDQGRWLINWVLRPNIVRGNFTDSK